MWQTACLQCFRHSGWHWMDQYWSLICLLILIRCLFIRALIGGFNTILCHRKDHKIEGSFDKIMKEWTELDYFYEIPVTFAFINVNIFVIKLWHSKRLSWWLHWFWLTNMDSLHFPCKGQLEKPNLPKHSLLIQLYWNFPDLWH